MADSLIAIERMCYGGAGFGRIDGKACFVPLTAPGDRVRVRVVKEKKSFVEARIEELVEPSPLRCPPLCPAFGDCGGCDWQHLPYPEQLEQKREIFADTLSRIGKVPREVVLPVAPSPDAFGYRSRVQVKVAIRGGKLAMGFFRTGSHEVVDIPAGCPLAAPALNRMMSELRCVVASLPQPELITQVELACGEDGEGIAIVNSRARDAKAIAERLASLRGDLPSVSGAFVRCGEGELPQGFGIDFLTYRIPAGIAPGSRELRLRFGRGGFSQVNYRQNLELVRTVLAWSNLSGSERVLDLYCGNGNFSLPVAAHAGEVLGVEGYQPSIADAAANADANGVTNTSFQTCDAALAVRRLVKRKERFDLVLLDPPRAGAEAAAEIALLAPERIIYVSCDPSTLARDLAQLGEKGYRVARAKPVDMFPQTYHLESVTELVRT